MLLWLRDRDENRLIAAGVIPEIARITLVHPRFEQGREILEFAEPAPGDDEVAALPRGNDITHRSGVADPAPFDFIKRDMVTFGISNRESILQSVLRFLIFTIQKAEGARAVDRRVCCESEVVNY